jgi:CHASE3 domain sensor protein
MNDPHLLLAILSLLTAILAFISAWDLYQTNKKIKKLIKKMEDKKDD